MSAEKLPDLVAFSSASRSGASVSVDISEFDLPEEPSEECKMNEDLRDSDSIGTSYKEYTQIG